MFATTLLEMHISISVESTDQLITADVPGDLSLTDFKAYLSAETSIGLELISLILHSNPLVNSTLVECGVVENDLIILRKLNNPSAAVDRQIEGIRQVLLNTPLAASQLNLDQNRLQQVINDPVEFEQFFHSERIRLEGSGRLSASQQQELARLEQNPDDPESQAKIMEMIKQERIDENLHLAYDISPELFAQVSMLYIPMTVNGHKSQAFVDTGAQLTIISPSFAEKIGISRLIDTRYQGVASGVGSQNIAGRIHSVPIKIGDSEIELPCTFLVLETEMDLLFGLDMLRRHQCTIDLQKNVMVVGGHIEVPFLHENQVTKKPGQSPNETLNEQKTIADATLDADRVARAIAAQSRQEKTSPSPAKVQSGAESESVTPQLPVPAELGVEQLMALGFSRQKAIAVLKQTDGNVELAASLYFQ